MGIVIAIHPEEHVLENSSQSTERSVLAKGVLTTRAIEANERCTVMGLSGSIWITMEGDPWDYVISEGQSEHFAGPGKLVFEGLDLCNAACIRISKPSTL